MVTAKSDEGTNKKTTKVKRGVTSSDSVPRKTRVKREMRKKTVEKKILADVKNISISEGTHTVWRAHQRTSRRNGKGFSLSELQDAGVSVLSARLMGLYVDLRRGTKHEENVSMLKSRTQK